MTSPKNRPVVLVATDADQYRQFGTQFGAEGSAYDVFYADQDQTFPHVGRVRPAVTSYSQD